MVCVAAPLCNELNPKKTWGPGPTLSVNGGSSAPRCAGWEIASCRLGIAKRIPQAAPHHVSLPDDPSVMAATACRIATPPSCSSAHRPRLLVPNVECVASTCIHFMRVHFIESAVPAHWRSQAFAAKKSSFAQCIPNGYVTDTPAFCFVASLVLMPYLRDAARLWREIALCLFSRLA